VSSSTILSSLGEPVLHRNSLATITDNWVVVRELASHTQSLVAINTIADIKTFKTSKVTYVAVALGCLLVSAATLYSKESNGATLPFALVGVALLSAAQMTRQASVGFLVETELIQTSYGTIREAATVVAAVRSAQGGRGRHEQSIFDFFSWLRAYIALLS
jgi:hypothetical protein